MSVPNLDALFQAVKADDLDGVKSLLESGCDANMADEKKETALFRAKSAEMVRLLVDKGADVNHRNKFGTTALKSPVLDVVRTLIDCGCDVNARNMYGNNALSWASSVEIANLLLEKGCRIDVVNNSGQTALFQAKTADIARLLIEKGCDVNHVDKCGTALFGNPYFPRKTLLLSKRFPVPCNIEVYRVLIEKGCDVNYVNKAGRNALFYAKSYEIACLLIDKGCDVNHVADDGTTALFRAKTYEIARLLIEKGCDPCHINRHGETALFETENPDIAQLLIDNGCDVNHMNEQAQTPLMVAAWRGGFKIVKYLCEAGAEINHVDQRGNSALSLASRNEDPKVAKYLLEHGANIDRIDYIIKEIPALTSYQETKTVFLEFQKFRDLRTHQSVLSLISDDLEEISGCLSAEAYKSSCIMSGAVLETFLTDWLSEILGEPSLKHVDDMPSVLINTTPSAPLTKPLLTKPKNNKSWSKLNAGIQSVRCYHQQKALEWSQFEKMAGFIRDARNSVHGNAHSKSVGEGVIDAEKCQNVLDNLKAIIHSRYWPVEKIESELLTKGRGAEFELLIKAIKDENIVLFDSVPLDEELISLEDRYHKTLSGYAAKACSSHFLSRLLNAGADVNHEDQWLHTPLDEAIESNPENVKLLLEAGADVNHNINHKCVRRLSPLFRAAKQSNPQIINLLLNYGADITGGLTPISSHIGENADPRGVKLLVLAVLELIRKGVYKGALLYDIVKCGDLDLVKLVLDAGVDVNQESTSGETPLFNAAKYSNPEVIHFLIEAGADVNHVAKNGDTPIFNAAKYSNPEVIQFLIEAGADVNHVARSFLDPTKWRSRNKTVKDGDTPIFEAALNSNPEVMKLFLCYGVDANSVNAAAQTPLFNAVQNSNPLVLKLLLDAGADVNHTDELGDSPLFVASENQNSDIAMLLIEAGANVNLVDKKGRTPLSHAVANSNLEVVRMLLEAGADVMHVDRNGQSLLYGIKNDKILRELVKAGADVNHVDYMGRSAIFGVKNVDVARELLNAGADIHIVDHKGKTVFDCCRDAKVKRFLYAYDLGCTMAGHEKIFDILDEDIQEVAACITAKCYKAACIMCGSILETFLKDWLSEITGKDFNAVKPDRINPLLVDNRLLKKEDVNSHRLYNYILATKNYHERLHEDWQALFDKAVMIRDNRNKVHASLCEDTGYVFDEALCETVLENLQSIIRSRFAYY